MSERWDTYARERFEAEQWAKKHPLQRPMTKEEARRIDYIPDQPSDNQTEEDEET